MQNNKIKTLQPNVDYFSYLNEIGVGKKNLVIDNVVGLVTETLLKTKKKVSIADIGCYNGVMLSVINNQIQENLCKRIDLYGYDYDQEMLDKGSSEFPNIKFIYNDLMGNFRDENKYDIVIVSNVLHEIYSSLLPDHLKAEAGVAKAMKRISQKIEKDGFLVLMDGLFPESRDKEIEVLIESNELLKKLEMFSKTFVVKFSFEKIQSNIIRISLKNLSMFLSKYKYMDRSYWNLESKQVYQYFDLTQFENLFGKLKMSIAYKLVQENNSSTDFVKIIKPAGLSLPAKNVLLVCKKA